MKSHGGRVLDELREEHRVILAAIAKAEALAAGAERGTPAPRTAVAALREFFTLYVHGMHQQKEDAVLFPLLRRKGRHEGGGCVGVLTAEHADAAKAFPESDSAGDWAQNVRVYCALLASHIRRENDVVFPMVESAISDGEANELVAQNDRINSAAQRAGIDDVVRAVEALP